MVVVVVVVAQVGAGAPTESRCASMDWSNTCGPRAEGILNLFESLGRRTVRLLREGTADESWGMACYEMRG